MEKNNPILRGQKLTMVINHLLTGMILQVGNKVKMGQKVLWYNQLSSNKKSARQSSHQFTWLKFSRIFATKKNLFFFCIASGHLWYLQIRPKFWFDLNKNHIFSLKHIHLGARKKNTKTTRTPPLHAFQRQRLDAAPNTACSLVASPTSRSISGSPPPEGQERRNPQDPHMGMALKTLWIVPRWSARLERGDYVKGHDPEVSKTPNDMTWNVYVSLWRRDLE